MCAVSFGGGMFSNMFKLVFTDAWTFAWSSRVLLHTSMFQAFSQQPRGAKLAVLQHGCDANHHTWQPPPQIQLTCFMLYYGICVSLPMIFFRSNALLWIAKACPTQVAEGLIDHAVMCSSVFWGFLPQQTLEHDNTDVAAPSACTCCKATL